jgi:hypothetical protein
MNATQRVAMRLEERRRPVERVVEVLRADERVAAAALTSSYARGETDGLSDLHLLVGVLDAHVGEFVPARRREVDRIAAVVWCFITVAGHPADAVGQADRPDRGPLRRVRLATRNGIGRSTSGRGPIDGTVATPVDPRRVSDPSPGPGTHQCARLCSTAVPTGGGVTPAGRVALLFAALPEVAKVTRKDANGWTRISLDARARLAAAEVFGLPPSMRARAALRCFEMRWPIDGPE